LKKSMHFSLLWLSLIFVFSLSLRHLWLFTTIGRDEGGIALVALQWIEGYNPYIHSLNNVGPIGYLIYAFPTYIFGPSLIPVRIINNILFLLSIIVLFKVTVQRFGKKSAICSSFFYGIFMNAPIYEGALALDSSLSTPFMIFSIYFCNRYFENCSQKELFIASFLVGLGALIKPILPVAMIILFVTVLVNNWYKSHRLKSRKMLNDFLISIIGFSIMPLIFLAYFWNAGAINNILYIFIERTLLTHPKRPALPFAIKFNVIVQGLPLWIFSIFGVIVTVTRKRKYEIIFIVWLILTMIMAGFPPQFGHRYIYLLAPASIFAGIGLAATLKELRLESLKQPEVSYSSITSLFLILLLLLSFAPSVYFQREQYPQYHIFSKSLNFIWRYADADSFNTQVKLTEFLRLNTSKEGRILVHGWTSTIYYLAGKLPPSKHVWTAPGTTLGVPEDEYKRLVQDVKKLEFEYVIFFDSSFAALERRRWDPIVEQTLSKYYYIKNLGNAFIFGKYNLFGEYKYFNFIENLPLALKIYFVNGVIGNLEEDFRDEPLFIPAIRRIKINNDERPTIRSHPVPGGNSSICYNLYVPERSMLEFGICIDPAVWEKSVDGVEFVITIKDEGEVRTIFSHYVDPKNFPQDRKWHDFRLPLDEFANRNVVISFITSSGPKGNAENDWAHWSNPLIMVRKSG